MLYFDHNATSPLIPAAREAWLSAVERFPANPSSPHRWGARAAHALDQARVTAAGFLGCSPGDLVWTAGATESANALFHHLSTRSDGIALISGIEHPCIRASARRWFGPRVEEIPVSTAGLVDLDWLEFRLNSGGVACVAVMAANNETGVLQPWQAAGSMARSRSVPFVCDAVQWLGKMPAKGVGECDFVVGSAHKFGGPVGVGLMKVPKGFVPLIHGGPQEEGRRAGTENVPGVLAMMAAWEAREPLASAPALGERVAWRDRFLDWLLTSYPECRIVGTGAERLWNTASVLMPPHADCRRRWIVQLDRAGVAASTGSACSSGKEQASHVLLAMGCPENETDRMIRFSAGWDTRETDWESLAQKIVEAGNRLVG